MRKFIFNRTVNFVVMMAACIVGSTINCRGDDFDPSQFTPAQYQAYEDQLNAILKTRRDQEKEFVANIVNQVRVGKLPPKLVDTSYQWVRNKRPNTNYPFIYFERVLRLQASKLKLEREIPTFDYSIYLSPGQRNFLQDGSAGQNLATTPSARANTSVQNLTPNRTASANSAGQNSSIRSTANSFSAGQSRIRTTANSNSVGQNRATIRLTSGETESSSSSETGSGN